MYFGSHVEAEMREAAKKAKTDKAANQKAEQVLARWLAEPGETPRFRDPAAGR